MLVSLEWLKAYVSVEAPHDELVDRLTMSGLNHEGTVDAFGDQCIDLEVTSNRPDCLGHIGVAREIAVLYNQSLNVKEPQLVESKVGVNDVTSVDIQASELCSRYTGRVIKGVKVGPSPDWIQDRLKVININPVNNIVDITNYVMMESGQPLHAFDFAKIAGQKITVRRATKGEKLEAIDHKTYELDEEMCVIADDEKPVAIAGVMGGAATEVSEQTVDVFVEAADFAQLSVRGTARKLKLHSPSSYRFERTVDPAGIDWASRRCCELILEIAGGELLAGSVDQGQSISQRTSIILRHSQIVRVLGINIPSSEVSQILEALGCEIVANGNERVEVIPPSWRRDLTREIDLIEEAARIHGYDKIPSNARVPMAATLQRDEDRVHKKIRQVLTSFGYDEAMTTSLVPDALSNKFSPWSDQDPIEAIQPMLGVLDKAIQNIGTVNVVRRSIVPSLLECRRVNDHRSNIEAHLFEIAKVYLPSNGPLPTEKWKISIVGSGDFYEMKGLVESLVAELNPETTMEVDLTDFDLLDPSKSCGVLINGKRLGWLGVTSASAKKNFSLRKDASVCELDIEVLQNVAIMVPTQKEISFFPAVTRDFNFIVDESIRWIDLQATIFAAGGELAESVNYIETFRDSSKDGEGKKRLLCSVVLRSKTETLTSEVAEEVCSKVIESCKEKHSVNLAG